MALLTYGDLIAQVPLWLARPTDTNVITSTPDWISLCEERIAYGRGSRTQFASEALRIRAMETQTPIVVQGAVVATVGGTPNDITALLPSPTPSYTVGMTVQVVATGANTGTTTLTVSSSSGSLSQTDVLKGSARDTLSGGEIVAGATYNFYYDGAAFILLPGTANAPLPDGYLASRQCYVDVNPRQPLEYMVPDQLNRNFDPSYSGLPQFFTIEGDSIRFGPAPDNTYYIWMNYYQKFPALELFDTNWLLKNAPSVYLYGTLIESAPFIGHDERLPLWYNMFRSAIDGLQEQDASDRHSGALLTMRPQHGCP